MKTRTPRVPWPLKLYIDDEVVAEQEIRTTTGMYALTGEGLCVGYDGGDAVSSEYTTATRLKT